MRLLSFSSKKGTHLDPKLSNSTDPEQRNPRFQLCGFLKQIAQYSNNNLVRNTDFLLTKNKIAENIPWVGANKQQFELTMFKLTY